MTPTAKTSNGGAGTVLIQSGGFAGHTFCLPSPPFRLTIGRLPSCELQLHPEIDRLVSREHALLEHDGRQLVVTDKSSRTGTHVGGRPIRGPARLTHGSQVQLGQGGPLLSFLLDADVDDAAQTAVLTPGHGVGAADDAPTRLLHRQTPTRALPSTPQREGTTPEAKTALLSRAEPRRDALGALPSWPAPAQGAGRSTGPNPWATGPTRSENLAELSANHATLGREEQTQQIGALQPPASEPHPKQEELWEQPTQRVEAVRQHIAAQAAGAPPAGPAFGVGLWQQQTTRLPGVQSAETRVPPYPPMRETQQGCPMAEPLAAAEPGRYDTPGGVLTVNTPEVSSWINEYATRSPAPPNSTDRTAAQQRPGQHGAAALSLEHPPLVGLDSLAETTRTRVRLSARHSALALQALLVAGLCLLSCGVGAWLALRAPTPQYAHDRPR